MTDLDNNDNDDDYGAVSIEKEERLMNQLPEPVVDYLNEMSWNNYLPNATRSVYLRKAAVQLS